MEMMVRQGVNSIVGAKPLDAFQQGMAPLSLFPRVPLSLFPQPGAFSPPPLFSWQPLSFSQLLFSILLLEHEILQQDIFFLLGSLPNLPLQLQVFPQLLSKEPTHLPLSF